MPTWLGVLHSPTYDTREERMRRRIPQNRPSPVTIAASRARDTDPPAGVAGPAAMLQLQRTAGNAAVSRLLAVQRAGGGACKLDGEELSVQRAGGGACKLDGEELSVQRVGPKAPPVVLPAGPAWRIGQHVTPAYVVSRPAATRSNTDPSTTSTDDPTFTGAPAVDAKGKVWRYQLSAVQSTGTIQLVFFTDDHYPAPTPEDDSGALTNTTAGNWKAVTKDLKNNRSGVPDFWSAYRREVLHEDYHWNVEWQGKVNKHLRKAEKRIASLKANFAAAPTEADADAVLKPQAAPIFKDEIDKARAAYNALGDNPGDRPYRAQAPALDALRARVRAHAKANKWK